MTSYQAPIDAVFGAVLCVVLCMVAGFLMSALAAAPLLRQRFVARLNALRGINESVLAPWQPPRATAETGVHPDGRIQAKGPDPAP
jgi:hypothetical protein